jgi:putative peptidoglycan lipid II flippase
LSIRAVVTGALRFGAGAGTAKLFGILRDVYIARAFGLGEQVDAYLLAQTMAMLPLSVIFLSLQPILTTAIARHAQAGEISVPRDLAKTIGMGFIVLALATLTIWFALPRFLGTLAGHPNFALIDGTQVAYGWIVAGAFCSAVSTLGYAVLHSRGKMLSSGLLPGVVPAVMVVLLAVMLPGTSAGNLGCALFLGYIAEMSVVILAVVRLGRMRVIPAETRGAGAKLSRQFYPMMLGMLMVGACPLIEQSFAVGLGVGAVSALGFASRVPAALGGLASSALSAAFLPVVAGQLGGGHVDAARRTFRFTAATMFLLSTIVAFLLWIWSDSIVGLLFLGGKFRPEDSERVSILQGILGFGIPGAIVAAIAGRALIALSIRLMHLLVPIVAVVTILGFNSILVPLFLVEGIALSNVLVALLTAAMLLIGAEIYLRRVGPARVNAATLP